MSNLPRFSVYIPARYDSVRLPGKMLSEIGGCPLILHTCRRALESGADEVVVATDDERIATAVAPTGVKIVMTGKGHASGTDRIAEAAARLRVEDGTIIVNLQGDEPFMPAAVIGQVACLLERYPGADAATVCAPFACVGDIHDPNIVKVVIGADRRALYFSRAPVPYDRAAFAGGTGPVVLETFRRHVGLYAFRARYLAEFVRLPVAPSERLEQLEQLRILHHGGTILCEDAVAAVGIGVDTAADLERVREVAASAR